MEEYTLPRLEFYSDEVEHSMRLEEIQAHFANELGAPTKASIIRWAVAHAHDRVFFEDNADVED